jgi:hypothetical protein
MPDLQTPTEHPAPATGQIWSTGLDNQPSPSVRLALLVAVEQGRPALVEIIDNQPTGDRFTALPFTAHKLAGAGAIWAWAYDLPQLVCLDPTAAQDAAAHLEANGIRDVLVDGDVVAVGIAPVSVVDFAEEARANGWATDEECARMIGRLG